MVRLTRPNYCDQCAKFTEKKHIATFEGKFKVGFCSEKQTIVDAAEPSCPAATLKKETP